LAGLSPIVTRKSTRAARASTASPARKPTTTGVAVRKSVKGTKKKSSTTGAAAKKVPILRTRASTKAAGGGDEGPTDVDEEGEGSDHDEHDDDDDESDDAEDEVQRRIEELQADAALERRRAELIANATRRASVSGGRPVAAVSSEEGQADCGVESVAPSAHVAESSEDDEATASVAEIAEDDDVERRLQKLQTEAKLRRQERRQAEAEQREAAQSSGDIEANGSTPAADDEPHPDPDTVDDVATGRTIAVEAVETNEPEPDAGGDADDTSSDESVDDSPAIVDNTAASDLQIDPEPAATESIDVIEHAHKPNEDVGDREEDIDASSSSEADSDMELIGAGTSSRKRGASVACVHVRMEPAFISPISPKCAQRHLQSL
jgi:hypothetical protein